MHSPSKHLPAWILSRSVHAQLNERWPTIELPTTIDPRAGSDSRAALCSLPRLAKRACRALPVTAISVRPTQAHVLHMRQHSSQFVPASTYPPPGASPQGVSPAHAYARSVETCRKPRRAYTPSPAGVACSVAVFLPSRAAAASMPRSSALASPRRRCSSCSQKPPDWS